MRPILRRSLVLGLSVIGVLSVWVLVLLSPLGLSWVSTRLVEGGDLGMDAARLVYSWPVMTGACIILTLLLFRVPLTDLIDRIESIKGAGLELQARAAPTLEDAGHRELLERVERWSEQDDHWEKLGKWARLRGRGSATLWSNAAAAAELEEIIKTLKIP